MTRKLDESITVSIMLKKGLRPLEPYQGVSVKWKSECLTCHRITHPTYWTTRNSKSQKKGCAICVGTEVDPKEVRQKMLTAGLKTFGPYPGKDKPWKCKCLACGKIVFPNWNNIRNGAGGCGTCRYVKSGKSNSTPENVAVAIMLKAKAKPVEPYANKDAPWKSVCLVCDKEINPTFGNVKKGKQACKWCSRKFIAPEEAIKIMKKQGYEPLTQFKGGKIPWKCRCGKCGKISKPTYSQVSRQKNITGCSLCNVHYVDESDATAVMLKAELKPLEPYKNARYPWKSVCLRCNNIVSPTYGSVRKGSGCNFCSPLGINLNIPSYLYLITHKELNAHKVGIGNIRPKLRTFDDRLGKFIKRGWMAYRIWNFETGGEAWKIESKVFKVVRKDLIIPIYLSKEDMPGTEGQTETMNADEISLLKLERIINKVIKGQRT